MRDTGIVCYDDSPSQMGCKGLDRVPVGGQLSSLLRLHLGTMDGQTVVVAGQY